MRLWREFPSGVVLFYLRPSVYFVSSLDNLPVFLACLTQRLHNTPANPLYSLFQYVNLWRIASLPSLVLDAVLFNTAYPAPRARLALHPKISVLNLFL